jgi:hypothetical protein
LVPVFDHEPIPLRPDGRLRKRRATFPDANWRRSVIEYVRSEAQPVDKFGHQPRLYALSIRICKGLDFDDAVLFAAAGKDDAIAKVGRDTRYATFSNIVPVLERAVDELPSRLRLKIARLLASERVKHLKSLIAAIHAAAGELLH